MDLTLVKKGTIEKIYEQPEYYENYMGIHGQITISEDFYIGKKEVTQKEWYDVMEGSKNRVKPKDASYSENKPIIGIRLYEAIVFCNRLSIKEKLKPVYKISGEFDTEKWVEDYYFNGEYHRKNGYSTNSDLRYWPYTSIEECKENNGYRLPTLEEWAFAAKGGVNSKNFKYPGSNNINEVCVFLWNSGHSLKEVATLAPNELGLYDMCGNAKEWCISVGGNQTYNIVAYWAGGYYNDYHNLCITGSFKDPYEYVDNNEGSGLRVVKNSDIAVPENTKEDVEPVKIGFKIETFLEGSLFNKITLYEDIKNNEFFSINRDGELISEYFTGNEFLDDDIINGSNHIYEVFLCSETEEKSLGKIKHKAKLSDRKESEKDISLIISEREALTKKILDSEELKKINKNIIGFYKNQYHFLNLLVNLDKYCRMIKNSENVISKLKEVKDMKKNKPKNNFLEFKKTENIEYDMIIKDKKIPLQISEIITNSKKGVV